MSQDHHQPPRILVVDDNSTFVESLRAALTSEGFDCRGCHQPAKLPALCKQHNFRYDLILLDMRLGIAPSGEVMNAMKMLLHLRTFSPQSSVVVFSQDDIEPKENFLCLKHGALAVIPKTLRTDDLVWLVHEFLETEEHNPVFANQKLIEVLWSSLADRSPHIKGSYLEMLIVNLFNATKHFRVVGQNINTIGGEIDVLVQNEVHDHTFWKGLNSPQIVVECKNRKERATVNEANDLADLVGTRGKALSTVGILVTMSGVTKDFRIRGEDIRASRGVYLFVLTREDIANMIHQSIDERREYLRSALMGRKRPVFPSGVGLVVRLTIASWDRQKGQSVALADFGRLPRSGGLLN